MGDDTAPIAHEDAARALLGSVGYVDGKAAPLAPEAARDLASLAGSSGKDAGDGSPASSLLVRGTTRTIQRLPIDNVVGEDERVRVPNTSASPWRMICALELRGPGGRIGVGTGWFVGPTTIITAGHCVYDPAGLGGWALEIRASPGRDAARRPFAELVSTRFSTTDRWFSSQEADFDFAAIHLGDEAAAVTADTGWFSTVVLDDAALSLQRVNVSGYPGDKGADLGTEQWFHAKQIIQLEPNRIFYDVDTMPGQSGAPVWLDTDDGPRVVGIHAYGVAGAKHLGIPANSAPRINEAVLNRLRGWVEQRP